MRVLVGALSNNPEDAGNEASRAMELFGKLHNDSNLLSTLDVDDAAVSGHVSGEASPIRGKTNAQEKNRRAQKRFRERQKANISSMQEQMVYMREEVDRLRKENKDLVGKNALMDKMLRLSNDSILSLQEGQIQTKAKRFKECAQLLETLQQERIQDVMGGLDESDTSYLLDGKGLIWYWKKLVKDASVLLIQYDCIISSDESKKEEIVKVMKTLLDKAGRVCMYAAVYNTPNFEILMSAVFDNGMAGEKNENEHWLSVITHLDLNEYQMYQFSALYGIYKERMGTLTRACSQKLAALQNLGPDGGDKRHLNHMVKKVIRVNEAGKELQLQMYEEYLCRVEFWAAVFKTILTDVQKARFIVESYPFFPDVPQVANLVATSLKKKEDAFEHSLGLDRYQ